MSQLLTALTRTRSQTEIKGRKLTSKTWAFLGLEAQSGSLLRRATERLAFIFLLLGKPARLHCDLVKSIGNFLADGLQVADQMTREFFVRFRHERMGESLLP